MDAVAKVFDGGMVGVEDDLEGGGEGGGVTNLANQQLRRPAIFIERGGKEGGREGGLALRTGAV